VYLKIVRKNEEQYNFLKKNYYYILFIPRNIETNLYKSSLKKCYYILLYKRLENFNLWSSKDQIYVCFLFYYIFW